MENSLFFTKFWGWYLIIFFFILSFNPKRIKHWNRPIFHGSSDKDNDPIPKILMKSQKWFDNEERLEFINRVRLWRDLIGDKKVDIDYWLTRLGII